MLFIRERLYMHNPKEFRRCMKYNLKNYINNASDMYEFDCASSVMKNVIEIAMSMMSGDLRNDYINNVDNILLNTSYLNSR